MAEETESVWSRLQKADAQENEDMTKKSQAGTQAMYHDMLNMMSVMSPTLKAKKKKKEHKHG